MKDFSILRNESVKRTCERNADNLKAVCLVSLELIGYIIQWSPIVTKSDLYIYYPLKAYTVNTTYPLLTSVGSTTDLEKVAVKNELYKLGFLLGSTLDLNRSCYL